MSGRALQIAGLTAFGGVSYYLYTSGGDVKLAEKKAERESRIEHDITNIC